MQARKDRAALSEDRFPRTFAKAVLVKIPVNQEASWFVEHLMNTVLMLLATLATVHAPCSAARELARAASAYRHAPLLTDTARIEVQIQGAPKHEESVEYGFAGDRVFMRIPATFMIELRRDRFLIAEEGRPDGYISTPTGDDLQSSLDRAFEGAGSPVIPPPVLLRRARTLDDQMQAFRLKVLGKFDRATCADGDVTLVAENGSVRFHVGDDGWIRDIDGDIATDPGQPHIAAHVSLAPRVGERPPTFAAHGRTVRSVSELRKTTGISVLPDVALRGLDGTSVRLRDPLGRTTVIEFWATWCAPCRMTLPRVAEFARSRKDIRVLLVNLQENPDRIRDYLAAANIGLATAIDADGSLHQSAGGGLPLTLVVSGDGRILRRNAGFDSGIAAWLAGIP